MKRILIAGATGRLGMRLVRRFRTEGYWVRALVREPQRLGLLRRHIHEVVQGDLTSAVPASACEGIDLVFSCASASTRLLDSTNESSFESVNYYGNVGLLRAALRARVAKFMYVAPLGAERLAHTAYGGAHERFVDMLHRSPLPHTVVRPTVYFENIDEAVTLLAGGHEWTMGTGEQQTNPIHEADLAEFCASLTGSVLEEAAVGGPHLFSRAQIAAMAREAAHRRLASTGQHGTAMAPRITNQRVRELLAFSDEIAQLDVVGPEYGNHDLREHLAALAGPGAGPPLAAPALAPRPKPTAIETAAREVARLGERLYSPLLALHAEPVNWEGLLA